MSPIRSVPRRQPPSAMTISTTELMAEVGCSYRQIDYWARLGLVDVAVGAATPGTGYSRRFAPEGVFIAKVVQCLAGFGFRGEAMGRAVLEIKRHSPAARLVYVKQDGSTDWSPGASAAIVMDLDQFRLKSSPVPADETP